MALLAKRNPQGGSHLGRTRWDPFEVMQDMMRWDPVRAFGPLSGELEREFFPTFDVKEQKNAYLFKGDLPGMKESDIEVSLTGNRLTISGTREDERRDEGEQYYAHERSYGSFMRTFTLPDDVDAENVDAEFTDGVLTVRVSKKAAAQPKKIELKSGSTVSGTAKQVKAGDTGNIGVTGGKPSSEKEKTAKA